MQLAHTLIETDCHVCAFFQRSNEEYKILVPFLKEGVDMGDKALDMLNPARRTEHVRRLTEAGMPVKRALGRGQLELREWQDTYLRTGRFARHDMIALLQEIAMAGEQRGTDVTRLWADMQWAAEESLDVRELVHTRPNSTGCFPGTTWPWSALTTSRGFAARSPWAFCAPIPLVIVGGALRQNPFYVEPDRFLRELSERVRLPDEDATVARSQLFILEEEIATPSTRDERLS
jgi:hypothetical protein